MGIDSVKRECILVEAARAFTRFGFRKTSIDEIAQKAGVAKGTVYLAAENKEDLFYQVLNREIRTWVAEMSKHIDRRVPADELLLRLSMKSLEYLDTQPLLQDLLFGKTLEVVPGLSPQLAELRSCGNQNIIEVLKLGIQQQRFRADIDVEEIAGILGEMQVMGYALFREKASPQRDERVQRRTRAAFDLILNGLMVNRPAAP